MNGNNVFDKHPCFIAKGNRYKESADTRFFIYRRTPCSRTSEMRKKKWQHIFFGMKNHVSETLSRVRVAMSSGFWARPIPGRQTPFPHMSHRIQRIHTSNEKTRTPTLVHNCQRASGWLRRRGRRWWRPERPVGIEIKVTPKSANIKHSWVYDKWTRNRETGKKWPISGSVELESRLPNTVRTSTTDVDDDGAVLLPGTYGQSRFRIPQSAIPILGWVDTFSPVLGVNAAKWHPETKQIFPSLGYLSSHVI